MSVRSCPGVETGSVVTEGKPCWVVVAGSGEGQVKQIASLLVDVFWVELQPSQSFACTYKNRTEKYLLFVLNL